MGDEVRDERPGTPDAADRFSWHPEPELLDYRDPAAARAALEAMGSATWDTALDFLYEQAMRRPVGPDTYPEARRRYFGPEGRPAPAPEGPVPFAALLDEFRDRIAPAMFNAQHPRAFSYFTPPPLPSSIAGEVLSQWTHQGVDVWHAGPVAAFVEEEVTTWLRELVGFDEDGWGVLTSGGVMANVMAMTVARDVHLRRLRDLDRQPRAADLDGVRVYASDQAHFSIARALSTLGFPDDTLRVIGSDERFRLHGEPVARAIDEDRAAGLVPLAIAAVGGSTNTGSIDLTGELADLARREGLWLHVDAAYGGAARLSERDAGRVPDLERADSVTVDPHKWFFQAYDIGGLLVRRRDDLLATFHRAPEYYRSSDPESDPLHWYQYSFEGTRRFRGLKLWLSWKHLGTEGLGRLVEITDDLAAGFAQRCRDHPDLEPVPSDPELSVVCFRHVPGGIDRADIEPDALDAHQDRLQQALAAGGDAWVSTTRLRGRTYLRAGFMNPMTTDADLDRAIALVTSLGAQD
ncbi:MAG: pyridoxal-dependent decarboxylase [Actinomycetota bacterium]